MTVTVVLPKPPAWMQDAACLDADPATFFPPGRKKKVDLGPARELCGRCDVRRRCREFAEATHSTGVFAGVLLQDGRRIA